MDGIVLTMFLKLFFRNCFVLATTKVSAFVLVSQDFFCFDWIDLFILPVYLFSLFFINFRTFMMIFLFILVLITLFGWSVTNYKVSYYFLLLLFLIFFFKIIYFISNTLRHILNCKITLKCY